jgi:hypothetical protein
MLSESATVAPLKPVPVGVVSSCVFDERPGMLSSDRFFLGWPSGGRELSAVCADADSDLVSSSAVNCFRDEDREGGSWGLAFTVELLPGVDPGGFTC